MRNLLIIFSLLAMFASCKPSIQPQDAPSQSWEDTSSITEVDSIPTITMNEELSSEPIIITITEGGVTIKSGNVNTVYLVEADKVFVKRSDVGLVEYIQVNSDILFKENINATVNQT